MERIGTLGGRLLLLQFGRRDFYIPLMAGLELRRAAGGENVELKPYDAEHDMRLPEARADRRTFLAGALGLPREGK